MGVAYITHPSCALHEMGRFHPERPERLAAINDRMISLGVDTLVKHVQAPGATTEQLRRVHDRAYVAHVLSVAVPDAGNGYVPFDADTSMNRHTAEAAARAAGAVVKAVEMVAVGEAIRAFCPVRPPGHHACYDRAMGFCFFNNIAVGAAHAIAEQGFRRVAIVDFDVHHGNGTEDFVLREFPRRPPSVSGGGGESDGFYSTAGADDPSVLFCSAFQHPFYPYSGADTEAANVVNVPLPAGTTGPVFRRTLEDAWFPALEAFAPDLLMISAGFDGHAEDDMGGWLLHEADYVWATDRLRRLADKHCAGRVVSVLEGGYALDALGRCVAQHVRALLG